MVATWRSFDASVRTAIVNGTLDGSGANKVQIDAGLQAFDRAHFTPPPALHSRRRAYSVFEVQVSLSRLNCSL